MSTTSDNPFDEIYDAEIMVLGMLKKWRSVSNFMILKSWF